MMPAEHPYIVRLTASEPLAADIRIAAELRFAAALEDAFGEPKDVAWAYGRWTAACNCAPDQINPDDLAIAARWSRAAAAARQEALNASGLRGVQFEIQLQHG